MVMMWMMGMMVVMIINETLGRIYGWYKTVDLHLSRRKYHVRLKYSLHGVGKKMSIECDWLR